MPIEPYPEDLEIHENPDSLVITYRGNQNRGRAMISFWSGDSCCLHASLIALAPDLAHAKPIEFEFYPLTILCLGSFILLLVYGAYVALSWALDQMLDREQVTFTATSLTVEKSGFGSIRLAREFISERVGLSSPDFQVAYV